MLYAHSNNSTSKQIESDLFPKLLKVAQRIAQKLLSNIRDYDI